LCDHAGIFDLLPLLERFTTSITHLMVEGGSKIISSFLTCPKNVVDLVIVTVAPVLVGEDGKGVAVAVSPLSHPTCSPHFFSRSSGGRGARRSSGRVQTLITPSSVRAIRQKQGEVLPELLHQTTRQFGKDTVLVCKLRHHEKKDVKEIAQ
jgi:hypothetical protein